MTAGLLIAGALLLTGYASAPLSAVFDRAVRTDRLRPTWFHNPDAYVLSISGENRMMIATADGRTICAEPLPDVARAVDTTSKIDVSLAALHGHDGERCQHDTGIGHDRLRLPRCGAAPAPAIAV